MADGITPNVDVSDIAPNATELDEAQERDYRWRTMVWGNEGIGKSHFAYTSPGPIAFIDTEGKAAEIAHKFDKEVFIFEPSDYEGAVEALDQSIELLDEYRRQGNTIGTIVVDSMSIMWDWAQQHYVEMYYPQRDPEEVELSSGLQPGGNSDWKKIKQLHNADFRQKMTDTPYHICWTAMREDDYQEVFEGDGDVGDKPGGEKHNRYKVNHIIRLYEDDEGRPVGNLEKSGMVRTHYEGLAYPTHEKHAEVVQRIDDLEQRSSVDDDIKGDLPHGARLKTSSNNTESE